MSVKKAVIFAGGLGTRLMEETQSRPKPMVEIGDRPLLWHIIKIYAAHGINEFVIPLGYKGYMIKQYFANYYMHEADISVNMKDGSVTMLKSEPEPWTVTLVETGLSTMTGGRLLQLREYLGDDDFCLTYGDGVADIDIKKLIAFHEGHGRVATVTAVRPPGRFGALELSGGQVKRFSEKPPGDDLYVNGGFFVLSPRIFEYLGDSTTVFEKGPLEQLARDSELMSYPHNGFWYSMDTLRDKIHLENLWKTGSAPWMVW